MRATSLLGCLTAVIPGAVIGYLTSGCSSSDGCSSARDCPSGQMCEMRMCVLGPGGGGFRDGGPRADAREDASEDAGGMDAIVPDAEEDSGMPPADADTPDAIEDSGMPPIMNDGGPSTADATVLPGSGLLMYVEVKTPADVTTAFGDFFDYSTAVYAFQEQRFTDGQGSSCTVTTKKLISGAPTPITATRINLTQEVGAESRELTPDSPGSGHFVPSVAPAAGFLNSPGTVVTIDTAGTTGSLAFQEVFLDQARMFFAVNSPALGVPVSLTAGVTLSWAPVEMTTADVELTDANREVVMRCSPIMDDGTYTLPPAAVTAWYTAGPTMPATLDLRFDTVRQENVSRVGASAIPGTFIVGRGVRWDAF